MIYILQQLIGINTDFKKVFFENEYKMLVGAKSRTIFTLLTILFLTFLALGFAVGSLGNLQQKMDDPFTNWINVDISSEETANQANEIFERYNAPEMKEEFLFRNSGGFVRFNLFFFQKDFLPYSYRADTLYRGFWGRTIDTKGALFKTMISENFGNKVWTDTTLQTDSIALNSCQIIITYEMMTLLGYNSPEDIGYIGVQHERRIPGYPELNKNMYLPLKVVGVVKELPDVDFVCLPNLYNALNDKRYMNGRKNCRKELISENEEGNTKIQLLCENGSDLTAIERMAMVFFGTENLAVDLNSEIYSNRRTWSLIDLSFMPAEVPSMDSIQAFIDYSKSEIPVQEYSRLDCEKEACDEVGFQNLHYLAFHFERLDKVKDFQQDLLDEFNVEIDMTQIIAKNNFAVVSRLTYVISMILLGFGVLSILLFVNSLLRSHLYKVRSNLGTFQAFGLNNKFLVGIYMKIILSFLLLSVFVAFVMSAAVDFVEDYFYDLESRFDIFNLWVLGAIFLLFFSSWFLSRSTINNILGDTPGNLIYGR